MWIHFEHPGYENIDSVEIPDENFSDVYCPKSMGPVDETRILADGMSAPIGSALLRDRVKNDDQILILIDDSPATPTAAILARVVEELVGAGVPEDAITVLVARADHRKLNDLELAKKLGGFHGHLTVRQHEWRDESQLTDFGKTKDGAPVRANQLLARANLVIGISSIAPHRAKGFTGGAAVAIPGAGGREISECNHWQASMHMPEMLMGISENPMRLRLEEAARLAGLRHVVDVVLDRHRRIIGCFAGDPVRAHRAGCALSCKINTVHLPRRADVAFVDAFPHDRNFLLSANALYAGAMAVREGGTIIVVSSCPEGVSSDHPILLELGYRPHHELLGFAHQGKVDDMIGLSILAGLAQIRDHFDCILVSPGVSAEECRQLGIRWAKTSDDALKMAFDFQGRRASVAALRHGGEILPVAGPR